MHGPDSPSPWVLRFAPLVAPASTVLDLACGNGRHALLFARRGCLVDAVDRDRACGAALAGEARVRFLAADLEGGPWPYGERRFDAIVVTNYLHRPLFPRLVASLADGGMLIFETFAIGNERYGKPSNPDFLLRPRELLDALGAHLHVLAYEDGVVNAPRPARIQRLCGLRATADVHERIRLDAID